MAFNGKILFILFGFLIFNRSLAQKINVKVGNLEIFDSLKSVNVDVSFDSILIEHLPEEEYIAQQAAEREEKVEGGAEKYRKAWEQDKRLNIPDLLVKEAREQWPGTSFAVGEDRQTKMVVETKSIEVGWQATTGAFKKPALLNCNLLLYDRSGDLLFKAIVTESPGLGYDAGVRIAKSYGRMMIEIKEILEKEKRKRERRNRRKKK